MCTCKRWSKTMVLMVWSHGVQLHCFSVRGGHSVPGFIRLCMLFLKIPAQFQFCGPKSNPRSPGQSQVCPPIPGPACKLEAPSLATRKSGILLGQWQVLCQTQVRNLPISSPVCQSQARRICGICQTRVRDSSRICQSRDRTAKHRSEICQSRARLANQGSRICQFQARCANQGSKICQF